MMDVADGLAANVTYTGKAKAQQRRMLNLPESTESL